MPILFKTCAHLHVLGKIYIILKIIPQISWNFYTFVILKDTYGLLFHSALIRCIRNRTQYSISEISTQIFSILVA